MPIVELTYGAVFCASHRLASRHLSDAENAKLFDKCNWANGHGHNYRIEATVRGEVDPKTGIFLNLFDLEQAVKECVVRELDHKYLNLDVPHFKDVNPTAENIAIYCWNALEKRLPKEALYEIRIAEMDNFWVAYRGGR